MQRWCCFGTPFCRVPISSALWFNIALSCACSVNVAVAGPVTSAVLLLLHGKFGIASHSYLFRGKRFIVHGFMPLYMGVGIVVQCLKPITWLLVLIQMDELNSRAYAVGSITNRPLLLRSHLGILCLLGEQCVLPQSLHRQLGNKLCCQQHPNLFQDVDGKLYNRPPFHRWFLSTLIRFRVLAITVHKRIGFEFKRRARFFALDLSITPCSGKRSRLVNASCLHKDDISINVTV